jgi:cytochrome c biogenesis protein CcmG, thiol:disulfide interchange protein DsbE
VLGPSEHDGNAHGQVARPATRIRLPARLVALVAGLAIVAVLVGAVLGIGRPPATAVIGQAAPDIRGTTLDGRSFDLAALRGKPVVVNFWASWCVPCRNEFPVLARLEQAHVADGVTVLGVLFRDSAPPAIAFARDHGGDWQTVTDPGGSIAGAYLVQFPPQTYFIDRDGVLRKIQYGELLQSDVDLLLPAILR